MFIGERQRLENRFRMIRHFTAVIHDGDMGSQLVTVSCRLSLTTVTKGRNWYTLASTWAFLNRLSYVQFVSGAPIFNNIRSGLDSSLLRRTGSRTGLNRESFDGLGLSRCGDVPVSFEHLDLRPSAQLLDRPQINPARNQASRTQSHSKASQDLKASILRMACETLMIRLPPCCRVTSDLWL